MKDFYVSKSHDDNVAIAGDILQGVVGLNRNQAVVIGLTGDLGTGKTTWTRGLVESLGGVADDVQSPTYVLMRDYDLQQTNKNIYNLQNLHHLDVYRFKKAAELSALKLTDEFDDPTKIFVVEWWRKVKSALPKQIVKQVIELEFETINDFTRTITVKK